LPAVALPARRAKNKRSAYQTLPPEVVHALRDYLGGRPLDQPVWPGTWFEKAAEMFRLDLEAAGIPYVIGGPDGPLYADFHALRHNADSRLMPTEPLAPCFCCAFGFSSVVGEAA
jgi:hypothetical protein